MIKPIIENHGFLQTLAKNHATFLLAGSMTKTCEIEGITQAGIPGLIPLTPTLDGEFVDSGKLFSLGEMAQTPKGVPTPAIITRAVRNLTNFDFEMLDLGLQVIPQVDKLHRFGIKASERIDQGANIDAQAIIEKGRLFGETYTPKGDYIILGESTPSGTTTARAVTEVLGFVGEGYFSSSFLDTPKGLKDKVITDALALVKEEDDPYSQLGAVADNMLLFCAGFASAYSKRGKIVLAGGTQMAAVLLVIEKLGLSCEYKNIALMTTKWVYEDRLSDIKGLLSLLAHKIDGYYADFDFADARVDVLKLYDQGEAKEGVGAGGALCYAFLQGAKKDTILKEIETVLVG